MRSRLMNQYDILRSRLMALSIEKRFMVISIFLCVILSLYFLLIAYPLARVIDNLKENNLQEQKLIAWASQASNEITFLKKISSQHKTIENQSLLTLIDHESKSNSWASYRFDMKELDDHQVQVTFNAIIFDDLIMGLEKIWHNYNIKVEKISIQRVKNSNLVTALIMLK